MLAGPKEFVHSPELLAREWNPAEARAYTRWLATSHYENFHVVSFLLPKTLHQDFYNVYAFCRWADDLGDELSPGAEALHWLAWWRSQLAKMYEGSATHPVFVALEESVRNYNIPRQPFEDLISAFIQDQSVKQYQSWEQLFDYCRRSANPVGRLLLYLGGYRDQGRQTLSDATCTALQLANFWQDVRRDLEIGRIYLPFELLQKHGCTQEDLRQPQASVSLRAALAEAVEIAQQLFDQGLPLAAMVDRRLAFDIELFNRGGMLILEKIRSQQYDVLARRPVVTKMDRVLLILGVLPRIAFPRVA